MMKGYVVRVEVPLIDDVFGEVLSVKEYTFTSLEAAQEFQSRMGSASTKSLAIDVIPLYNMTRLPEAIEQCLQDRQVYTR